MRSLSPEECDDLADFAESEMKSFGEKKPNDPRIGQKIDRKLLKMWGKELSSLKRPSAAMQAAAETARMSESLARTLGGPNFQNELTTTAMLMAIDLACIEPPGVIGEGSPDLSGLT